jgi:hypothetical protein
LGPGVLLANSISKFKKFSMIFISIFPYIGMRVLEKRVRKGTGRMLG